MRKIFKKSFLVTILGMSLFSGTIHAQDINVDSAKVRVTSGAFIVGTRNLIISNDSGLVNNSGTIYASGDISNSGRIVSDGVEILNGTTHQTITGVHGTSNLGNVFRNQPTNINIVAGSDVRMHTFDFGSTNGFFYADFVGGYSVRILSSTDTAIKNYSSNKYFDLGNNFGTLERAISILDHFAFPVGNSIAGYRLLDYHPESLGATGVDFVGLRILNGVPSTIGYPDHYQEHFSTGFDGMTGQPGICIPGPYEQTVMFDCLTEHYWRLAAPNDYKYFVEVFNDACNDLASGVGPRRVIKNPLTGSLNRWFVKSILEDLEDVTHDLCVYSDWTRVGDTIPGGVYEGGGFLAIATGALYPLPVELTSLTATAGESEILLDWETASEHNTDKFEVLRSVDAVSFQKIGKVFASGNSNVPRNYQFIDENVEVGIEYYYQLKQVDYDERFDLSNIVSAQLVGDDVMTVLQVYPNPTHGLVYVSQNFDSAILSNIVGQQIKVVQNSNAMLLNELPAGTYVLQVKIGEQVKSFKVQKL